jgi:hypothetical protein
MTHQLVRESVFTTPIKETTPTTTTSPANTAIAGPKPATTGEILACTGHPPAPRWGCTATLVDSNRVLVFGGESDDSAHNSDVFELKNNHQWDRLVGAEGPARSWHSAVYSKTSNAMIVFGGRSASQGEEGDVLAFDCELNLWYPMTCSGKPPSARQGHSAVIVNFSHTSLQEEEEEFMLVFGGSRKRVWYNDVHLLDCKTLRWGLMDKLSGAAPAPRSYHSCVAVGLDVVVFGGNSAERTFNDVHVLSLATKTWSKMMANDLLPSPRCGACLSVINDPAGEALVLFGGWDVLDLHGGEVEVFNDVWVLRLQRGWQSLVCASTLQHTTGAACWRPSEDETSNTVMVFGGQGAPPESKRSNRVLSLSVSLEERATETNKTKKLKTDCNDDEVSGASVALVD